MDPLAATRKPESLSSPPSSSKERTTTKRHVSETVLVEEEVTVGWHRAPKGSLLTNVANGNVLLACEGNGEAPIRGFEDEHHIATLPSLEEVGPSLRASVEDEEFVADYTKYLDGFSAFAEQASSHSPARHRDGMGAFAQTGSFSHHHAEQRPMSTALQNGPSFDQSGKHNTAALYYSASISKQKREVSQRPSRSPSASPTASSAVLRRRFNRLVSPHRTNSKNKYNFSCEFLEPTSSSAEELVTTNGNDVSPHLVESAAHQSQAFFGAGRGTHNEPSVSFYPSSLRESVTATIRNSEPENEWIPPKESNLNNLSRSETHWYRGNDAVAAVDHGTKLEGRNPTQQAATGLGWRRRHTDLLSPSRPPPTPFAVADRTFYHEAPSAVKSLAGLRANDHSVAADYVNVEGRSSSDDALNAALLEATTRLEALRSVGVTSQEVSKLEAERCMTISPETSTNVSPSPANTTTISSVGASMMAAATTNTRPFVVHAFAHDLRHEGYEEAITPASRLPSASEQLIASAIAEMSEAFDEAASRKQTTGAEVFASPEGFSTPSKPPPPPPSGRFEGLATSSRVSFSSPLQSTVSAAYSPISCDESDVRDHPRHSVHSVNLIHSVLSEEMNISGSGPESNSTHTYRSPLHSPMNERRLRGVQEDAGGYVCGLGNFQKAARQLGDRNEFDGIRSSLTTHNEERCQLEVEDRGEQLEGLTPQSEYFTSNPIMIPNSAKKLTTAGYEAGKIPPPPPPLSTTSLAGEKLIATMLRPEGIAFGKEGGVAQKSAVLDRGENPQDLPRHPPVFSTLSRYKQMRILDALTKSGKSGSASSGSVAAASLCSFALASSKNPADQRGDGHRHYFYHQKPIPNHVLLNLPPTAASIGTSPSNFSPQLRQRLMAERLHAGLSTIDVGEVPSYNRSPHRAAKPFRSLLDKDVDDADERDEQGSTFRTGGIDEWSQGHRRSNCPRSRSRTPPISSYCSDGAAGYASRYSEGRLPFVAKTAESFYGNPDSPLRDVYVTNAFESAKDWPEGGEAASGVSDTLVGAHIIGNKRDVGTRPTRKADEMVHIIDASAVRSGSVTGCLPFALQVHAKKTGFNRAMKSGNSFPHLARGAVSLDSLVTNATTGRQPFCVTLWDGRYQNSEVRKRVVVPSGAVYLTQLTEKAAKTMGCAPASEILYTPMGSPIMKISELEPEGNYLILPAGCGYRADTVPLALLERLVVARDLLLIEGSA